MGRVDRRGVRRRDSDSNSSGGHGNSSPSTVVEKLFKTYTTVDHGQESKVSQVTCYVMMMMATASTLSSSLIMMTLYPSFWLVLTDWYDRI